MSTSLKWVVRFAERHPKWIMGTGGALLIALPLIIRDMYWLHEIVLILWFGYIAACWNLISGYTRQVSLCHASFIGIGAYTSVVLFADFGITPWLGMFAGAFVAVLLSLLIGYPTLRLVGIYFVLGTFGILEAIKILFYNIDTLGPITIGGVDGISVPLRRHDPAVFQFMDKAYYYYIILFMLAGAMYLTYRMENSKWGYYLRAINGDEDAARSLGINVTKYKLQTFVLSAALAAIGGSFYAQFVLLIAPNRLLNWPLTFEMLVMAMVGGRGTVWGPILGAVLLVPVHEIIRTTFGGGNFAGLHLLFYGVLLILIVLFMPKGLAGIIRGGYLRLQRNV